MTGESDGFGDNDGTVIRPEESGDADAVHALLVHAFATSAEAQLVARLRREGDLTLALVATDATGAVVGHAGFSRLKIDRAGREFPAVSLAPVAVAASQRRRGIGANLVNRGLRNLGLRGETLVFVLGDPLWYQRFGFSVAAGFASRYAGPHFMALRLASGAPCAGAIRYPAAFDDLG